MEFPRHCHKPDGSYVVVQNADQYDAVRARGWTDRPEVYADKPVEVRYAEAITGAAIDVDAASPAEETPTAADDAPKKRGRKAKG